MPDTESFKLVTNRKGKRRCKPINLLKNTGSVGLNSAEYNLPIETLVSTVKDAVNVFKDSPYKTVLLNGLSESLRTLNFDNISLVVCYGLGNFCQQRSAKYQLAALLCLKSHYDCDVYVYDPLFNGTEIEALKLLGLKLILENEEGKRQVGDKVTLLFAIHCCKQLINNFLYANWNANIKNCIIYGNSWDEIVNNSVTRNLERVVNYIMKIRPIVQEINLANNFVYFETFSSSSLHIFPPEKLRNITSEFWTPREEPCYQEQDIEFVRRQSVGSLTAS